MTAPSNIENIPELYIAYPVFESNEPPFNVNSESDKLFIILFVVLSIIPDLFTSESIIVKFPLLFIIESSTVDDRVLPFKSSTIAFNESISKDDVTVIFFNISTVSTFSL